jgi:hypothetical protein
MKHAMKLTCPRCGAVNGLGAPWCHTCGATLSRVGFAARPVDDDEDDEPRPAKKKPAPRRDDDDDDDEPRRPAKKPVSRRDDDYDDDEPRRPAKKKPRQDEEEESESLRDNPILNMFFPVGVSIWAMGANYLGAFSILGAIFGFALAFTLGANMKILGMILPGVGAFLGFLAIIMGLLSFIIRPKKTTYGSVTGYMRAVIGIILGFIGLAGGPIVIYFLSTMPLR